MREHKRVPWPFPIAEVVGPPGSGKTTLVEALGSDGVVTISRLRRQYPYLYLQSAIALAPMLKAVGPISSGPWTRWNHLVRLRAALELPARYAANGVGSFVFDQGPVFALARLGYGDPISSDSPAFTGWLEPTVSRWAATLSDVIILDAPDDVLLSRIRSRTKFHALKNNEDESARPALTNHREVFEAVIHQLELQAMGRLRIHRYDTSCFDGLELSSLVERELRMSARALGPSGHHSGRGA